MVLTLPRMGLLSDGQALGAIKAPLFFLENFVLYGVYIHVYTHKPCLHDNFQTSPISPCGAMTSFLATNGNSFCKNGRMGLKIGQHTSSDA